MPNDEKGITITSREIYNSVIDLSHEVNGLSGKIDRLEDNLNQQARTTEEALKVSREALRMAEHANYKVTEAQKDATQALEKSERLRDDIIKSNREDEKESRTTRVRFYIAIFSAVLPWILTMIGTLIYLSQAGL